MIGFIGIGNMGGAMAKSIALNANKEVCLYDINTVLYDDFEGDNIIKCKTIEELTQKAKYIVLSIKPQYYTGVCAELKSLLDEQHIIITVAPGFGLKEMKELLGEGTAVIRTMPNTPALIGQGVTAYCYEPNTIQDQDIATFLEMFKSFGKTFKVDESQMEAVVAVSGSSPAYGYMFIEAMADAAVSFGMPRAMAYEMAAMSIKGACEMVLETKKHPGALKDEVTSPGGTTIQAVTKLEETGFRHSVISGMTACYNKAKDMNNK